MTLDLTVARRLRTVQGHLEAVLRMVDDDEPCLAVLHQLSAVKGGLDAVHRELLKDHWRHCLQSAAETGKVEGIVDELLTATFGGPVSRGSTEAR